MKQTYNPLAKSTKRIHSEVKSNTYKNEKGHSLATLNQLHGEFKTSLSKRKGVKTKYLEGYLDFFVMLKNIKYKYDDKNTMVFETLKTVVKEKVTITLEYLKNKPLPINLFDVYGEYKYGIFSDS